MYVHLQAWHFLPWAERIHSSSQSKYYCRLMRIYAGLQQNCSLLILHEGHSVLEDGISHQDLLVRRAVVFGLGLIRNDWSRTLLQRLQTQEAQWVVRTAAVEALELLDGKDPAIPHKIPEPHLCPWFIQAASNTGEGISPGKPPIGLLLKLLDNGTDEEKCGVLDYLSFMDQEVNHFPHL